MTQEEKQLLHKDLCARLPYGFIIHRYSDNVDIEINTVDDFAHFLEYSEGEDFKPYLRPKSSMTEDEWKEFSAFIGKTEMYVQQIRLDADSMANPIIGGFQCVYWGLFDKCVDWLNKNMFDYRGLIPMGLALEAKEGMYNN